MRIPLPSQNLTILNGVDAEDNAVTDGKIEYIIFGICLNALFYIYLLISICIRKCKLAHVAYVNYPKYPGSLKFKLFLTIIVMLAYAVEGVLSFM